MRLLYQLILEADLDPSSFHIQVSLNNLNLQFHQYVHHRLLIVFSLLHNLLDRTHSNDSKTCLLLLRTKVDYGVSCPSVFVQHLTITESLVVL